MDDIDFAKKIFFDEKLNLIIVKNNKVIFKTYDTKITGVIKAIDFYYHEIEGASMVDRVVGKAIALLSAYCKIKNLYSIVMSTKAIEVLKENKVIFEFTHKVDVILDIEKKDICPFEKVAADLNNPKLAYLMFKDIINNFSKK